MTEERKFPDVPPPSAREWSCPHCEAGWETLRFEPIPEYLGTADVYCWCCGVCGAPSDWPAYGRSALA